MAVCIGVVAAAGSCSSGTGVKECEGIAYCFNPSAVDSLYDFNQQHKNYVLLFSSRLTTSELRDLRQLHYSDFSNASVFIELQDAEHKGDPLAHLGGQLAVTRKFFGVLDFDGDFKPNFSVFDGDALKLRTYERKVKVIASEKQDKMYVLALD